MALGTTGGMFGHVQHEKLMRAFVEAAVGRDEALATHREALVKATDEQTMREVAGVMAHFCLVTRCVSGSGHASSFMERGGRAMRFVQSIFRR